MDIRGWLRSENVGDSAPGMNDKALMWHTTKTVELISNIIRTIRHEIYRFEQCAEYGLNESEKMQYFYNFIRNQLPARYNFLNTCGHEISAIIF